MATTASRPELGTHAIGPIDLVRIGAGGLAARRLRSALTALGIAIGIAAMVGVLAISESSRASLLAELDRLGTNLLTVSPGQTLGGGDATLPESAEPMIERIRPVDAVSAVGVLPATVRRTDLIDEAETGGITLYAADPDLLDTLGGSLRWGRFLDAATSRYPTVVLGAVAAERLGLEDVSAPVDVYIDGRWFSVIGVLESLTLAPEIDRGALIGWDVAEDLLGAERSPSALYVRAEDRHLTDVREVLPATADPENPEEVRVSRPSDAIAAKAAAATTFTALFLGLGAIALLVGGLGIANVMLMAVLERRAEIGLRRALGATRGHIAGQFVAEALLLAGLGGAAGVALGSAVGAAYARSQGWLIAVPPVALIGGIVASLLIGGIAGLYPALRAAATPPTDALRTA